MRHLRPISFLLASLLALCFGDAHPARAQAGAIAWLYCYTGSGAITSSASYLPCSAANPLQVSGGGGGGGAVTIADGADVAEGATTDAAAAAGGTGTVSAKLRLLTTQLGTINTTLGSPFQAGGSIGNTSFAVTQPTAANLNATVVGTGIFAVQNTAAAGENHIGEVGGNILPITVSVTTTAVATIATGDSIGGIQTFSNAVRVSGALGASGTSGFIQDGALVFTDTSIIGPLDIYFFNAALTTSTCTNDSAFALTAADYGKVIGIAHVTDATATTIATAPITLQFGNLARAFGLASSTTLRACIVWRGSATITTTANSSSQFTVNVLRN